MKKSKIIMSLIIGNLLLTSCGETEKPLENKGNKEALKEIKKEPKIIEAFFNDANVLYVSVEDDGTNRNGYAQYLCEILNEKHSSCSSVKIVKVNSINDPKSDNAFGIILGESDCK